MTDIPSAAEVRRRLLAISLSDLEILAGKTGAPFTTLVKIRNGQTGNPRVETVRAIWPDLPEPADADTANEKART